MLGVDLGHLNDLVMFCLMLGERGQRVNFTVTIRKKYCTIFGLIAIWEYHVLSFTLSCGYDIKYIILLQLHDQLGDCNDNNFILRVWFTAWFFNPSGKTVSLLHWIVTDLRSPGQFSLCSAHALDCLGSKGIWMMGKAKQYIVVWSAWNLKPLPFIVLCFLTPVPLFCPLVRLAAMALSLWAVLNALSFLLSQWQSLETSTKCGWKLICTSRSVSLQLCKQKDN